jgi:flagellar motor switch protein FliM
MLGGSPEAPYSPRRPLTEIEQRLLSHVLDELISLLNTDWRDDVAPASFRFDRFESSPRAQCLARDEPLYVTSIRMEVGAIDGLLRLAYTEPFLCGRFPSSSKGPNQEAEPASDDGSEVEFVAVLARRTVEESDYRQLAEGDVIATGATITSLAEIWVDGTPRFLAKVGQHNGRKAVEIKWLIRDHPPASRHAA